MTKPYDPVERLMDEHRQYEKRMDELKAVIGNRDARLGVTEARKVAEFAQFFESEVEGFHGRKEETVLFPALTRYLPSPGPIEVMIADHREMRANETEMKRSAAKLESDGESPEARGRVVSAGTHLISSLLNHIQKEDNVLFPTARNVLDAKEWKEVVEGCLAIERERGRA